METPARSVKVPIGVEEFVACSRQPPSIKIGGSFISVDLLKECMTWIKFSACGLLPQFVAVMALPFMPM